MNVEYVELNNREYVILEKIYINNILYYILGNENVKNDICVRKEIIENDEKYLIGLDNEAEFDLVMEKYIKKLQKPIFNCLPIGSIVTLHDCNFKVMIMGYLMKDKSGDVYDYCGCRFPEGLKNKLDILCFDDENITGIKKAGYIDDAAKILLKKIEDAHINR